MEHKKAETYGELYEQLKQQYTKEEIADGAILSADIDEETEQAIQEQFKNLRLHLLKTRSAAQGLGAALMRMRLLMQDYVKSSHYDLDFSFSKQLSSYIKLTERTKKDFAADVAIHPTRLSRLLNGKETPSIAFLYRLERHSSNMINAVLWWQLVSKDLEQHIRSENRKRNIEQDKVQNALILTS